VGSASNNNVYLLMRQVLYDKKMMNRGLSVLCIFQVANSASEEALINFDDASLGKLSARLLFAFFGSTLQLLLAPFSLSHTVKFIDHTAHSAQTRKVFMAGYVVDFHDAIGCMWRHNSQQSY